MSRASREAGEEGRFPSQGGAGGHSQSLRLPKREIAEAQRAFPVV